MIIEVKRDKGSININRDFAGAVEEFADVLNDERLGVAYMAYVIFILDGAENNIWFHLPEAIRKKEVAESLKLDADLIKDKKVVAAIRRYRQFCEQNISYQFKDSYMKGLKKVSDYVDGTGKLGDDNAKKFSDVLAEMPSLLKGRNELEKLQTKEAAKGRISGGKQLTQNERGH